MRQGKKTVQLATAARALSRLTTSWIASWKVLLLHLPAPKLLGSAITGCTLLLVQAPPECAGLVSNTQIAIPCSILSTPALLGQHEGLLNITETLSMNMSATRQMLRSTPKATSSPLPRTQ